MPQKPARERGRQYSHAWMRLANPRVELGLAEREKPFKAVTQGGLPRRREFGDETFAGSGHFGSGSGRLFLTNEQCAHHRQQMLAAGGKPALRGNRLTPRYAIARVEIERRLVGGAGILPSLLFGKAISLQSPVGIIRFVGHRKGFLIEIRCMFFMVPECLAR